MAKQIKGLYIDAEMRDAVEATSIIKNFMVEASTEAHVRNVIDTSHNVFAALFDERMNAAAKLNPSQYHHVYEYSETGNPYSNIGKSASRLWRHTKRHEAGAAINFSWDWKAARYATPTYAQRRDFAHIGKDAIIGTPRDELEELIEHSSNRRHVFHWKAPMLEYNIRPTIVPRYTRALAIPVKGKVLFTTRAQPSWQHPGKVDGNFTRMWTNFWADEMQSKYKEVIGNKIEEDAARQISLAISKSRKKPRKRTRQFEFRAVMDFEEALVAGQQQALAAIKTHARSIKKLEKARGGFHNIGLYQ